MTPDDVKKIRSDMRPGHHILTNDVVEAIDWLADALRASQAQTVQMREDAARVAEKAQRLRGRDCCEPEERIAKEIRALPAPAARTYDDGVREPIAEVRHACGRAYLSVADVAVAMEGDPMRDADLPEEAYEPIPADELDGATIGGKSVKGMDIRVVRSFRRDVWSTRTMKYVAKRINDAALLSPAPAVAPVAEPVPRASGVTDKELIEGLVERVRTLEGQLPEYVKDDKIIYRECEKGHGRLLVTTWVDRGCPRCEIAPPKPGPTVCADCGAPAIHHDVKNRLHATLCCGSQRCCFFGCMGYATRPLDASDEKPVAFDAEAALDEMAESLARSDVAIREPLTLSDMANAIYAALAAGRGAR